MVIRLDSLIVNKKIVPILLALSFPLICLGQNGSQSFYKDTLLPVIKSRHTQNFTVQVYDTWLTDTGVSEPQLNCYRHYYVTDNYLAFETDTSMEGFNRCLFYDKQSFRLIDWFEGFVVDGDKSKEDNKIPLNGFRFCIDQMLNHHEIHYRFLLRHMDAPYFWRFHEKIDTIIDGQQYFILRGKKVTGFTIDTATSEKIPVTTEFEWFCDATSLEITQINVFTMPYRLRKSIRILDYSYDNRDIYVDSIFFHNAAINRLKHFDCSQSIPPAILLLQDENKDTLTFENSDSIFNLPIVSLYGDTITLNKQQGWVLLDLWTIRCKPCLKLPIILQQEQKELGYRKLERAGVKIMYVNGTARTTNKMREHVAQWGCEDITYACEGLLARMKENSVPQYYLISPNKKVVWHSNNFISSEEIINIIKENNHE